MNLEGSETSEELHFFYDAQSRPAFVEYNGVKFRYIHNLQGDIVAIVDAVRNPVVEYKYDAWGKLLSTTGTLVDTLGKRNPFRYRGYVYDEENEMYYLCTRMYMPLLNRFMNSDKYVIVTSYPLRSNIYAYCSNEPVMHVDRDGEFFKRIITWFKDTIIGGLIDRFAPGQLNVVEKELAKDHPVAASKADWARNTANTITAGLFGSNWNSDNTRENAFKHCLWNALMAYSMGEDLARKFGEAHEYGMMEHYPESTKMDLHNNEVGYSLVVDPPTPDELSKSALARYATYYESIYPSNMPPVLNELALEKHSICLIVEGFEEEVYLKKIIQFPAIQNIYKVTIINAKTASNIPIYYQAEFSKNIYEICLVVCDKDRIPTEYNNVMEKLDRILGPQKAQEVVFFTCPCTLQIILSHFAEVSLKTQAKKDARPLVESLTGVKGYDAHQDQLKLICDKIFYRTYPQMKERIAQLSSCPDDLPSTNLLRLFNCLESIDSSWICPLRIIKKHSNQEAVIITSLLLFIRKKEEKEMANYELGQVGLNPRGVYYPPAV